MNPNLLKRLQNFGSSKQPHQQTAQKRSFPTLAKGRFTSILIAELAKIAI
jgi:hypothetical protein